MELNKFKNKESQDIQRLIISKIRDYINYKNLESGDKLPSERMLSEKFEVSRSNLREAIQKMEFYGILKSKPQSGTFVANIGVIALNGIIDDVLNLETPDFRSLVESRIILELQTVRLAALRRTKEDLKKMKEALDAYEAKVEKGKDAVQEDLLFHLAIAKACGNITMVTFMLIIAPEIITNFEKHYLCYENQKVITINEHQEIYSAIVNKDPKLAREAMKNHFNMLYQYCYNSTMD